MAFMTIPMIAGLAMSAAGAAANYAGNVKRQNEIDDINKRTRMRVSQNEAQARAEFQASLKKASPDAQKKMVADEAARRQTAMDSATEGAAGEANIIKMGEGTPAIVKTEAAKQLGTALDSAKQQMAASAQLGAWNQLPGMVGRDLGRSGDKINQLGNFTLGLTNAAGTDINAWQNAQASVPLGDMLQGAGGAMIGGSGPTGWATNLFTPETAQMNRLAGPVSGIKPGDLSALF